MKRLLLLLMLLIPVAGYSANKKKPKPMPVSRWKEVKRMSLDSTVIPFTDTLYIAFRPKDSFAYHVMNGFIYKGVYTIDEDSLLDFGTARYRMPVRKPLVMVLTDAKGIYQFSRDSSDTAKIIVLTKDEKILPVTDVDVMIGHWTVFKRASKEMGTVDNESAIRSLYVTGPSTDGKLGYVYSGSDANNNPSWYIKNFGADQTLDCDGKNPKTIKVIKCQNGELVLEENGVSYYLKQFK